LTIDRAGLIGVRRFGHLSLHGSPPHRSRADELL
jgi:hypothetical protein